MLDPILPAFGHSFPLTVLFTLCLDVVSIFVHKALLPGKNTGLALAFSVPIISYFSPPPSSVCLISGLRALCSLLYVSILSSDWLGLSAMAHSCVGHLGDTNMLVQRSPVHGTFLPGDGSVPLNRVLFAMGEATHAVRWTLPPWSLVWISVFYTLDLILLISIRTKLPHSTCPHRWAGQILLTGNEEERISWPFLPNFHRAAENRPWEEGSEMLRITEARSTWTPSSVLVTH